jgi:signal transduction histidine kinase
MQLAAHEDDLAKRRPFQNLRFQRIGKDGGLHHISISGKPIFDVDGIFRGYRGTGRDVTAEVAAEMEMAGRIEERTAELRKAQSELLRKERLSTLGQLTATVAHELRNPLSSIRNTVFAIREASGVGSALERPIGRVERNVERCDRIISDLLDFTRLKELRRSEIELDPWLVEILNEQRFPEGIALTHTLNAPGHSMSLDGERMRRVVINLIENASQALAEAKDAPDRRIAVATRPAGAIWELVIEDNGPGIPAEVLPKVFEPLFSTKSFGTGLGLPTVKQIVEQHGGTVEITSERGKGTRITVRLPMSAAEEKAA